MLFSASNVLAAALKLEVDGRRCSLSWRCFQAAFIRGLADIGHARIQRRRSAGQRRDLMEIGKNPADHTYTLGKIARHSVSSSSGEDEELLRPRARRLGDLFLNLVSPYGTCCLCLLNRSTNCT
jgi:hypothetical protein